MHGPGKPGGIWRPVAGKAGHNLLGVTDVLARYVHNNRLHRHAIAALSASPGARACYDLLSARGTSHLAALRQLANRLTGILHGCLKTRNLYDEVTAWPGTLSR